MAKRKVHFVLGTHWDREWHHTFQDFRYYLVKLFNDILDGWENGSLLGPFQTDGQAIILEDYLEIHPERRPLIKQHAKEGRLVIGPWYVMPDEFNVSGESLIRNIRLGREIARDFGGTPSSAGYMCDIFGHISQMPQILDGFQIPAAFLWRGTNPNGKRNLIWEGADGTEIAVYRFGGGAYCDYATNVRRAHDHSETEYDLEIFFDRLENFLEKEVMQGLMSLPCWLMMVAITWPGTRKLMPFYSSGQKSRTLLLNSFIPAWMAIWLKCFPRWIESRHGCKVNFGNQVWRKPSLEMSGLMSMDNG